MSPAHKFFAGSIRLTITQEWSEEKHLDLMQNNSIAKSIISISSPGVHLVEGDKSINRQLARQCNNFASDLAKRQPEKFGFWAALPLPDIEGTLAEISYSLENLHPAGFAMETNH